LRISETQLQKSLPTEGTDRRVEQVTEILRRLERRDWWLWSTAIIVSLLLTTAVVSTSLPAIRTDTDDFFRFNLDQAVRGLVGIVLLFNVYVVYQQVLIKRFRRKVAEQMIVEAGLRTRAEELEKIAIFDPSTGLYNARYVDRRLATEIARSHRYGYPFTVVLVEIDGFSQIGELGGQSAARRVLQEFARLLTEAVSVVDVTISLGGGEFMLLLPECTVEEVPHLLQRLGSPEVELSGKKFVIPLLVRSAAYRPGESAEELLRRAENAVVSKSSTLHLLATQGPRS
jgi:diguanylate cyclase (GGDEF)-like protein